MAYIYDEPPFGHRFDVPFTLLLRTVVVAWGLMGTMTVIADDLAPTETYGIYIYIVTESIRHNSL